MPMTSWSWIRWETRKTALFLIISDTDATFNFLISLLLLPAVQPAL